MRKKKFKGKNILITGGARGIGVALVKRFALEGSNVYFTYKTSSAAALQLAREFDRYGVKAYKLDVTSYKNSVLLVKRIIQEHQHIDILVNNAGITMDKPMQEMKAAEFRDVIETNLTGTFNLCRAVIPYMMTQRKGSIVNVSSVSAIKAVMWQVNYAVSKAGILGLTRTLAKEMARYNINVNAVCPGFIETDMLLTMHPHVRSNLSKIIPLGRIGRTEEVAGLVAYLASNEATYITGQSFIIDGGLSI
ncbi:MAG: 3-oxoacyl-ACP reductase family protein [Candidatus Omnitrophota bacterium]